MYVRLMDITGTIHRSKDVSDEEVLELLKASNFHPGTGSLSYEKVETVEEMVAFMNEALKQAANITLNVEDSNADERVFYTKNVVWYEVVR